MNLRVVCVFLIFSVLSLFPVSADYNRFAVPDSSEIRRELVETWFLAPLEDLRMKNSEIRRNEVGQQFQIRLEEQDSSFTIFVSPEVNMSVDVYSDKKVSTVTTQVYPGDASGSWMLVRDRQSGDPLRIRYYFSSNSDVYVQFTPSKERTFADMVIYGNYAARSLPVGIPYDRFYTASFADIYAWTAKTLPWQYCTVREGLYHSTLQMIQIIRECIPEIVYADDAMYDGNGKPVYISTGAERQIDEKDAGKLSLSGAGFVKWVVDGLVVPLRGSYIKRAPLLVPTVEYKKTGFPGTLDSMYDLSFSLDWTRNLAAASFSVQTDKMYLYRSAGVDVSIVPFSSELTPNGIVNSTGYIRDTGYAAVNLQGVLYVLAATEPYYCYLAAIRQTSTGTPEVKPFNDCAVIFPYFDSAGRFACTVFQNGTELTLQNFVARYKNDFVHLVRVRTSDRFFPQQVK